MYPALPRSMKSRNIWFRYQRKMDDALQSSPAFEPENSTGVPDVIRGEETQIFGALDTGNADRLFVLPGTHSKWARVKNKRIEHFATFMTGEVFAILCEHSILGRTMKGSADDAESFKQGFAYAMNEQVNGAGLLQQLFSARTLALFNRVPGEALHAYLSGLLIGQRNTRRAGIIR